MSSRLFPWFFVVAGLLLFVAFSLFSVSETEYAILNQIVNDDPPLAERTAKRLRQWLAR